MKNIILFALCVFLTGCTTVNTVGSKAWHNQHLDEIREAHLNGRISTETYLEMKADADKIRREYVKDMNTYFSGYSHHHYCPRYGYGFGYHHGPFCRH